MIDSPIIEARDVRKRFGTTQALDGLELSAERGTVLGVLGPNGAGKSTAVRVLTTLTKPDSGTARVAGFDVVRDSAAVQRRIGVAAQDATIDAVLTGAQNLRLVGRLSGLSRSAARSRAGELLRQFGLEDAGDRIAKGYSGGMRRRLDLAAAIVTRPEILFLDEPTTGLDPASRSQMWKVIRSLVTDGTTLLLTTQYLDEADELADRIVVIDRGRTIADGTAAELKARVGGARLEVTLAERCDGAADALAPLVDGAVARSADGLMMRATVPAAHGLATAVVRALDDVGAGVDDVQVRPPSLDDVFFALTGPSAADCVGPAGRPTADREFEEVAA